MRISALLSVLAALIGVACATTPRVPVSAIPAVETPAQNVAPDGLPSLPPEVNLSGSWTTGTGTEPALATIVIHGVCNYTPAQWLIEQSGDSISAWTFPARQSQGVARRETESSSSRAGSSGRISGLDVVIREGPTRYVLRYDPASRHLRGTRDGQPFWAIRQRVEQPSPCPAVP